MLIKSFAIDRFGLLAAQQVEKLSPGLNVFLGSNEAGKSTCLRFFRTMFFGYRRGKRNLDPLSSSGAALAGGSLSLDGSAFGPLTLIRRPGKHGGELQLSGADGKSLSDADLHSLFGGMSAELYDAVFAFSLKNLSDFSSLSGGEVRHALHGAAFGYVRSPAAVLKTLEGRMRELLKDDRGQAAANLALRELDALRAELGSRAPDLSLYATAKERLLELEAGLDPLQQERDLVRQALARTRRRLGVWQDWRDLAEADADLAALPPDQGRARPDPEAGAGLDSILTRLEERSLALEEADRACLALAAEEEALRAATPDWDAPALLPLARSLKEEKEGRLAGAAQLADLAAERSRLEDAQAGALTLLGLEPGAAPGPPSLARREALLELGHELRQRGRALEEATKLCSRLEEELAEARELEAGLAGTKEASGQDLPGPELKSAVAAAALAARKALEGLPAARARLESLAGEAKAALLAVHPQWSQENLLRFAARAPEAAGPLRASARSLEEALAEYDRLEAKERDAARALEEARKAASLAGDALNALDPAPGEDLLAERREQLQKLESLEASLEAARAALDALGDRGEQGANIERSLARNPLFLTGAHLLLLGAALGLGGLFGELPAFLYSGASLALCALVVCLLARRPAARDPDPLAAPLTAAQSRCLDLAATKEALLAGMAEWLPQKDGLPDCAAAASLVRDWSLNLLRREEAQKNALNAAKALERAESDQSEALTALQKAGAALEQSRKVWSEALESLALPVETAPARAEALLSAAQGALLRRERVEEAKNALSAAWREVRDCLDLASSHAWFAARMGSADEIGKESAENDESAVLASLETLEKALIELTALEAEQRERERRDSALAERIQARERLGRRYERALAASEAARMEKERVALAWKKMLPELGLDPKLGPETASEALKELQAFASRARDLAALEERRAAIRAALAAFAAKVEDLALRAGQAASPVSPEAAVPPAPDGLYPSRPEGAASPEAAFAEALPRLELLAERIERAAERAALAGRLKGQLALKNGERDRARAALDAAQAELAALLAAFDCDSPQTLRAALALEAQRRTRETRRQSLFKNLERAAEEEGVPAPDFLASLQGASLKGLGEEEEQLLLRSRALDENFAALAESLGRARQQLESLEDEEGSGILRQREARIKDRLFELSRQWAVPALAREFLLRAKRRFEEEGHEGVIRFAGDIFARVTGGAYSAIAALDDGAFAAVTRTGERRDPESQLSRGTREQLYLALRLAYVQNHAAKAGSLPLIMDDILVNFDPERARAMAAVLAAFSEGNQLLFFTCQPAQAELLAEAASRGGCPLPRLFSIKQGRIAFTPPPDPAA